jgi:hypothetical protein
MFSLVSYPILILFPILGYMQSPYNWKPEMKIGGEYKILTLIFGGTLEGLLLIFKFFLMS